MPNQLEKPWLICGDFNESNWGSAWKYLVQQRFKDALDESSEKTTWYWPLIGRLELWGSFDHVFYNPKEFCLKKCEVFVEYKGASDHLPVLATFED